MENFTVLHYHYRRIVKWIPTFLFPLSTTGIGSFSWSSATPSALTIPGPTISQSWSPKPAADSLDVFCDPSLSLENQVDSQSARPLSIAQWSTALRCGLSRTSASHLPLLDTVESKATKIIGISHDDPQGLLASHRRQVDNFSVFQRIFSNSSYLQCSLSPATILIYSRIRTFFQWRPPG